MTTQSTDLVQRQSDELAETVGDAVVNVAPPVDIYESSEEILVVADFPDVPADGVNVRLEASELSIEGTQRRGSHGSSVPVRHFRRTFRVPNTVDTDGITADLRDGILYVHLAKSEAAKPRRVEVRAA